MRRVHRCAVLLPVIVLAVLIAATPAYSQTMPQLGHVVVIALENHSYGDVVGNSAMPYYNSLISQGGLAQNFFANVHGSFPDYAMLTSGELITANGAGLPADFPLSIENIERDLIWSGKTWKVYAEGLPSAGYLGGDTGLYVKRHNPFAYMSDNINNSAQAANIVPFSQFATDVANNALPNFSFIIPNVADDAEDCPGGGTGCSDSTILSTADQWLQANVPQILNNPAFQQDGLLILWWDEGNAADTANGGGQVPVTLVGPTVKTGFRSTTPYRHEHVLRTITDGLGLTSHAGASVYIGPMAEFFGPKNVQPGSITGQVSDSSSGAAIAGATVSYSGGSTTTDSSGNYTLSNVAPGSYTVTASASGHSNAGAQVSVTSNQASTLNFQLAPVTSSPGAISGRVTNISTGGAVSGATVSFSGGSATTDANGNYSFSGVTPGSYSVTASHSGFFNVTHSVTVSSGQTSTLNFAMATGGKIGGTVTNSSGAVIANASVTLTGGSIATTVHTTTDSSGVYNSNWMPVGNYTVTVSASGFTTQSKAASCNTGTTTTLNFTLQ